MGLELRQSQSQTLSLRLALIAGGLTGARTVFPLTEKELMKITVQRMLYEAYRIEEGGGGYRSVMDMLLCETLTQFQGDCQAFYDGKGARFKDLYPEKYLQLIDRNLLGYLGVARLLAKKKCWSGEDVPQWRDLILCLQTIAKEGE